MHIYLWTALTLAEFWGVGCGMVFREGCHAGAAGGHAVEGWQKTGNFRLAFSENQEDNILPMNL